MDPVSAASLVKESGKDVIFNVSPRDMNRLAIQMYLLGAQARGLQNVLVLKGDNFTGRELERVKDVSDFRPSELVQAIRAMNEGLDFKGLKLTASTDFCIGATADLGKGIESEAALAARKAAAGAQFLVTQSVYRAEDVRTFNERFAAAIEQFADAAGPPVPVFYGLQVLVSGGVIFGDVPEPLRAELERGRPGRDIALELAGVLREAGVRAFYVIPPILKGGRRDYPAAQQVLDSLRAS